MTGGPMRYLVNDVTISSNNNLFPMGYEMKNNADMFDERGDPWSGDLQSPIHKPHGVPLKLSRAGHIWNILHKAHTLTQDEEETHSTRHALPIKVRLAKEQNTRIDSMALGSKPVSPRSALLNARAKANARRASHLIKVK